MNKSYIRISVLLVTLISLTMVGYPQYNVWQKGLLGQARLAEAEQSRLILIEEAKARFESAKYNAQADSVQAVGAANANNIIGESLKENEAYLRYLWIKGLQDGSSEVIYIPTEANLPILEARDKR